ncbi:MAG: amidohydrolase family protein [Vicinamibacterales bacterium]
MTRYRAAWIVPVVSPPIRDGWVDVEDGRITGVGQRLDEPTPRMPVVDLGAVAVLPAFVNAHTHLELSALRGLVAPTTSMPAWVRRLMAVRTGIAVDSQERALDGAVTELLEWGTAAVGDVSNTLAAWPALARSGIEGVVFHELIGFGVVDGRAAVDAAEARWSALPAVPTLRLALAPHAPYSVSPELLEALAGWTRADAARVTSMHVGESHAEVQFLLDGTGEWRRLLEDLGAWRSEWRAPGVPPLDYVAQCGLLTARTLVVHGTQFDDVALARLRAAEATLVMCPRSNRWTGAGVPPVRAAWASGVRCAFGTDSLASGDDLGVPGEIADARRLASDVPARWLLQAATRNGAAALGLSDLGAIEAGYRARLITVALPAHALDVEEWLVGGLDAAAIDWLPGEAGRPSGRT